MIDSTRDRQPSPGTTQPLGMVTHMDPLTLLDYLKDRLQQSGHPEITAVEDVDTPALKVECSDGSRLFPKVCWVGRADQLPTKPSWPSRDDLAKLGARR